MKRDVSRTLYFEDVEVGDTFTSPARTVTETDIVNFAALSGDWNPLHTDAEFAAATPHGRPVAHGLLGLSILTGLQTRLGLFDGSAIALLGLEWRFTKPIFAGDTVHFEMTVEAKRLTAGGDRGILTRSYRLVNQRDEVVQEGTIPLLVRLSPEMEAT